MSLPRKRKRGPQKTHNGGLSTSFSSVRLTPKAYAVRPGHPADKGLVGNAVLQVERRIFNSLFGQRFMDLDELNKAVSERLKALNDRPMVEKQRNRAELYAEEKGFLQSLPSIPYELDVVRMTRKVRSDYRGRVNRKSFSVPHEYAGKTVEVRLWASKDLIAFFDIRTGAEIARFNYGTSEALLESIKRLGSKTGEQAELITKKQLQANFEAAAGKHPERKLPKDLQVQKES